MRVTAFVEGEGYRWRRFRRHRHVGARFHAILFSNGRVWDTYNGFRRLEYRYPRKHVLCIRKIK